MDFGQKLQQLRAFVTITPSVTNLQTMQMSYRHDFLNIFCKVKARKPFRSKDMFLIRDQITQGDTFRTNVHPEPF